MSEPDLMPLSDAEEVRFAALFDAPERLSLGTGWQDELRAEIAESTRVRGDGSNRAPVVALTGLPKTDAEKNHTRHRLLFAAAALVLVAMTALVLISLASDPVDPVDGIQPRDIGAPSISEVELPDGAVGAAVVRDGVATWTEDRSAGTTTLYLSQDFGATWTETATLDVVDAVVSTQTETLLVVGSAPESYVPYPGIDGFAVPTALRVVESFDGGSSWSEQVVSPSPSPSIVDGFRMVRHPSAARYDDLLVVSFADLQVIDGAPGLRAAGAIGPDDQVVRTSYDDGGATFFATGPDVFGALDARSAPVVLTTAALDAAAPDQVEFYAAVGGEPLQPVTDAVGFDQHVGFVGHGANLERVDGGVLLWWYDANADFRYRYTTDGTRWSDVDHQNANERFFSELPDDLTGRWEIRVENAGRLTQSTNGGSFSNIPLDLEGRFAAQSAIRTEFGFVAAWVDTRAMFDMAPPRVFEEGGYEVEFWSDLTVTLHGPDGTTLIDRDAFPGSQDDHVVFDDIGGLQIFDDSQSRVALFDPTEAEDFGSEIGFATLMGWSTDGADWNSVEPDTELPGNWLYTSMGDGVLAVGDGLAGPHIVTISWPDAG